MKEVRMQKGTKYALILGAIPFITLVFALPLVNRIEPIILGLPFLLFWILSWVMMSPAPVTIFLIIYDSARFEID